MENSKADQLSAPSAVGPSEAAVIAASGWLPGDDPPNEYEQWQIRRALGAAYAVDFPARPTGGERARALEEALARLVDAIEREKSGGLPIPKSIAVRTALINARLALAGTPERGDET